MTYPDSWLDIANRALVKTGNQSIESLSGGTDNVRIVNNLLPSSIENVVSLFPWRCCVKRRVLAAEDITPEFEYEYKFWLPNDFATIVKIFTDNNAKWSRENNYILTNSKECKLIYIALPENPDALTPALRELITLRLAYNIVQTTTSNTALMQLLLQEFAAALKLAKRDEASGEEDITIYNSDYIGWNDYR